MTFRNHFTEQYLQYLCIFCSTKRQLVFKQNISNISSMLYWARFMGGFFWLWRSGFHLKSICCNAVLRSIFGRFTRVADITRERKANLTQAIKGFYQTQNKSASIIIFKGRYSHVPIIIQIKLLKTKPSTWANIDNLFSCLKHTGSRQYLGGT